MFFFLPSSMFHIVGMFLSTRLTILRCGVPPNMGQGPRDAGGDCAGRCPRTERQMPTTATVFASFVARPFVVSKDNAISDTSSAFRILKGIQPRYLSTLLSFRLNHLSKGIRNHPMADSTAIGGASVSIWPQ